MGLVWQQGGITLTEYKESQQDDDLCRVERSLKDLDEAEMENFDDLTDDELVATHTKLSRAAEVLVRHPSYGTETKLAKLLKLQIKQLMKKRAEAQKPHLVSTQETSAKVDEVVLLEGDTEQQVA